MTVLSFDDVNGNGITRDAVLDTGDTFDSRVKNTNYGGTGGSNNTLLFYQGAGCAARKAGATGGHGFTVGNYTSRDTTAVTYRTVMAKMWITNYLALNAAGMDFCIGSGTGAAIGNNQHHWTMADDGTIPAAGWAHPPGGGWIIKPIDVTLRAFRRGETGTPVETAMVNFAAWVDLSSTGGTDQNLLLDSPDYVETGFHVVGGTASDPQITFSDVVAEDEGSVSTNFARAGLWKTVEGVIYFFGGLVVGRTYGTTVTASEFNDSFKTLICPGGYVREGFNELEFDIGNVSTTIELDNITIVGRGRSGIKRLFDGTVDTGGGDVDVTLDQIDYIAHGFETGEQLIYDREGNVGSYVTGAALNGEAQLVTGTTGEYYYAINVSADVFAVASSFVNALAATRLALSAVTGETHSFTRTPDTRYDFTQTGLSGTLAVTNSNLTSARIITLDTNGSINDSNLITCGKLLLQGGTIDGNAIVAPTVWNGEGFIVCTGPQLANIDNCVFTGSLDDRGAGHAIEVTSATDVTYTFAGNTFSNYASYSGVDHPWDGSSASIVDTVGNDITITGHPYTSGEAVYYEDNGGTAIGGLTDGTKYYLNSLDANTVAVYAEKANALANTNRISLTGVGTGITHRFDSANAAIWNNASSDFTISVTGGGSPSVRNTGAFNAAVSADVSVTVTVKDTSAAVIANAQVAVILLSDNSVVMNTLSNGSGITSGSFSGSTPAAVSVRARKSSGPNTNEDLTQVWEFGDIGSLYVDNTGVANSTASADWEPFPNFSFPSDACVIGRNARFDSVTFDSAGGTAGIGGVGTWQYWDGEAWTALAGVTDGTSGFTASVSDGQALTFTIPADWKPIALGANPNSLFYIRFLLSTEFATTEPVYDQVYVPSALQYIPVSTPQSIESTGLTTTVTMELDPNNAN